MDLKKRKPELLAPAGNLLSAVVALDSGADAVYIGLDKFNARDRADNFTLQEASKLVNYAHTNGQKVYITLNTLIKQSELSEAATMLADISELSPDAVIVQDLGIVNMIRELYPSLKIHASTQMGIHNSAGVKTAKDMGIERVILERQVLNTELKEIISKAEIELEIFVQGALCCCLSGRCLFSSWLGAWSGNRGKCTQPCRRRFFSENGNGFFFSTKDLATLNYLPELIKLGISSFKIEGRLKKPDYIKNVINAYRLIIDDPKNNLAMQEAEKIIQRTAGRQISDGFSSKQALKDIIEPNKMGVTGIYCGKIISTFKRGFTAEVTRKIHIGDILRLQQYAGDDSSALSVSSIIIDGKPVNKALRGDICFIKCSRSVPENASIYKTGESYARIPAKIASLPLQRHKIALKIKITSEGFIVSSHYSTWKKSMHIEQAEKHPLTEDEVIRVFSATNLPSIAAGKIKVEIEGDLFIPASKLKQTRRECWEHFVEKFPKDIIAEKRKALLDKFEETLEKMHWEATLAKQDFNPKITSKKTFCGKDALELAVYDGNSREVILPPFCPEDKLNDLKVKIESIYKKRPNIKFRITSLYLFDLIKDLKQPNLLISFPFPVCNSFAISEIRNIAGDNSLIETIQAWIELEEEEIKKLIDNSPIPIEMFIEGQVPLMVTRAEIPVKGIIHDDRGAKYFVYKEKISGMTYIFSEKNLKIKPLEQTATFINCHSMIESDKESSFNFNRELV